MHPQNTARSVFYLRTKKKVGDKPFDQRKKPYAGRYYYDGDEGPYPTYREAWTKRHTVGAQECVEFVAIPKAVYDEAFPEGYGPDVDDEAPGVPAVEEVEVAVAAEAPEAPEVEAPEVPADVEAGVETPESGIGEADIEGQADELGADDERAAEGEPDEMGYHEMLQAVKSHFGKEALRKRFDGLNLTKEEVEKVFAEIAENPDGELPEGE